MTSKASSSTIQLSLRLAQAAEDRSWAVFQVPGTAIMAKVNAADERLGDWKNASVGSVVEVRLSTILAEQLKLYTLGGMIARPAPAQTPKNG